MEYIRAKTSLGIDLGRDLCELDDTSNRPLVVPKEVIQCKHERHYNDNENRTEFNDILFELLKY